MRLPSLGVWNVPCLCPDSVPWEELLCPVFQVTSYTLWESIPFLIYFLATSEVGCGKMFPLGAVCILQLFVDL